MRKRVQERESGSYTDTSVRPLEALQQNHLVHGRSSTSIELALMYIPILVSHIHHTTFRGD